MCSNHGSLSYEVRKANRNVLWGASQSFLSCWSLILSGEHGVYMCLRLSTMSVHTQLEIGFVHLHVISQPYRGVSFDNHILSTLKLRSLSQSLRRVAFTGVETLTPFPGFCKATPVCLHENTKTSSASLTAWPFALVVQRHGGDANQLLSSSKVVVSTWQSPCAPPHILVWPQNDLGDACEGSFGSISVLHTPFNTVLSAEFTESPLHAGAFYRPRKTAQSLELQAELATFLRHIIFTERTKGKQTVVAKALIFDSVSLKRNEGKQKRHDFVAHDKIQSKNLNFGELESASMSWTAASGEDSRCCQRTSFLTWTLEGLHDSTHQPYPHEPYTLLWNTRGQKRRSKGRTHPGFWCNWNIHQHGFRFHIATDL